MSFAFTVETHYYLIVTNKYKNVINACFQSLSNPSNVVDLQVYAPGIDIETYPKEFRVCVWCTEYPCFTARLMSTIALLFSHHFVLF